MRNQICHLRRSIKDNMPHSPWSKSSSEETYPPQESSFFSSRVLNRITYHLHHPITAFILLPSFLCFSLSVERKPVICDVWCSSKVTMERTHTHTHTHTHTSQVSAKMKMNVDATASICFRLFSFQFYLYFPYLSLLFPHFFSSRVFRYQMNVLEPHVGGIVGECNELILSLSTVPLEEVTASVIMKRDQFLRPLNLRSLSELVSKRACQSNWWVWICQ